MLCEHCMNPVHGCVDGASVIDRTLSSIGDLGEALAQMLSAIVYASRRSGCCVLSLGTADQLIKELEAGRCSAGRGNAPGSARIAVLERSQPTTLAMHPRRFCPRRFVFVSSMFCVCVHFVHHVLCLRFVLGVLCFL